MHSLASEPPREPGNGPGQGATLNVCRRARRSPALKPVGQGALTVSGFRMPHRRHLRNDVVECDYQKSISGRTAGRIGVFHSMICSSCSINLKLNTRPRYSRRVWSLGPRRGPSVGIAGTAGGGAAVARRRASLPQPWTPGSASPSYGELLITPLIRSDAQLAAASNVFAVRCAYRCVTLGFECPRIGWTSNNVRPSFISMLAKLCRMSWRRRFTPASFLMRSKTLETVTYLFPV
jgi:hypothetical protein